MRAATQFYKSKTLGPHCVGPSNDKLKCFESFFQLRSMKVNISLHI